MEILEKREQWTKAYRQGWLATLEATGVIDWQVYPRAINEHTPAAPAIDLSESRLMLISSAGGYLVHNQEPFDAANPTGDYTLRTFASVTPFQALAFAHDHYDHTLIERDPQVALPLHHLQEAVAAGRVGSLTPSVASFMGYQPDVTRVIDELAPRIVAIAKEERADAALLAPV
jgi:hypothetical protein